MSVETERIGKIITLYSATITADTAIATTPIKGLHRYKAMMLSLEVSGKVMDGGTTLDLKVQGDPTCGDGGWDDIVSWAQITNAAIADGTYVCWVNPLLVASFVPRAVSTAVAAGADADTYWGDRLRVVGTPVNFAGTDQITITIKAIMIPA